MKGIHSSFCRVRSNSLTSSHRPLHTNGVVPLTFFDSPPPPIRPGILTTSKGIPTEQPNHNSSTQHSSHAHGGHPPLPLALGTTTSNSSHSQSQYAMFTYSTTPPKGHSHLFVAQSTHELPLRAPKRQRLKYQLDVGAYGIPKRCKSSNLHHSLHSRLSTQTVGSDDLNLAVQVGEDAYFVRDNAMGVADGVGGWAKRTRQDVHSPTPSALFARRLMHYCSAEVDSVTSSRPTSPRPHPASVPSRPQFSFQHHLKPRSTPIPPLSTHHSSWLWEAEQERLRQDSLEQDLQDSLEELSEGINVLQILERAYDRTIKAHVAPPAIPPLSGSQAPSAHTSASPDPIGGQSSHAAVPLMSGSSTALLAVLDHAPRQTAPSNTAKPDAAQSKACLSHTSTLASTGTPTLVNYAEGTLHPSIILNEQSDTCDAVIRVAHIGDCMGMLVRGDDIIWRSEEMWWDFNMPLQLGPVTHPTVTPSTSAHYFTLPVRADDILILASDGLSDNLWDEEVLDEVVKFRRNFLGDPPDTLAQADADPPTAKGNTDRLLRRKALAGMLSEALCSRARKVSERRWSPKTSGSSTPTESMFPSLSQEDIDEVPFARRAREAGRVFRGGKHDDISVIVAVISPAEHLPEVVLDEA